MTGSDPTEAKSTRQIDRPMVIVLRCGAKVWRAPYHAGETILETARREGIPLQSQCEKGFCGTCMVQVVKGAVRLRNNKVLTKDELESGLALACQGEPEGPICEVEFSA